MMSESFVKMMLRSVQMELRCCLLLLLLVSVLWPVTCDDGATVQEVVGKVGGAVRLTCKIDSSQVMGIYFQRKNLSGDYNVFVNGFYKGSVEKYIPDEYRSRTSVNKTEHSLDFWDLTAFDEGYYKCYIVDRVNREIIFHLTITADYSVPTVTVRDCREHGEGPLSCVLSCSTHGGYPQANLSWTVSEGLNDTLLKQGRSVSSADKHTGVWNISQTIRLNCTGPANVSCSVGGAVSTPVSICAYSQITPNHPVKVIIASVVLFLFIFTLLSVFLLRRLCRASLPADELAHNEDVRYNPSPLLDQAG